MRHSTFFHRTCWIGVIIALFAFSNADALTTEEALYSEIVFLRGIELGAGGRALALGGAYRALSDDLSALYWNPAGLASVRRLELTLGISQAQTVDDAQISTEIISNQLSRTRLNELGIVFPIPTYRGSLVFAVGYHQVHGFDTFGTFQDQFPDSIFTADEWESGRLGQWSLGMGIDISPQVSVGLALHIWSGYDDYSYNDVITWDDNRWALDQTLNLDLSGFNAITGILIRPAYWLRVGATLESPLKLKIEESYSKYEEYDDDLGFDAYSFVGAYEYKLSRSFRGGIGAATLIGPLIISADASFTDWSQIEYKSDPPYAGFTQNEANRDIARSLKSTVDLHLGTEVWVPDTPVRFQLGYAWLPSPYKGSDVITDKHVFNGGISTLLDESLLVQTSLSWTGWERTIEGWGEDLQLTHLLMTLSYRF
jgi:hypothetical protein